MSETADEERDLRLEQLRVDIRWKAMQMRWEPWKAMVVAAAAGAGVMGALIAAATLILSHIR